MTILKLCGILITNLHKDLRMVDSVIKKLNWIDVLIIILLVRTTYVGFKKGFLVEIFKFVGGVLAIFIANRYYVELAKFVSGHSFLTMEASRVLSFIALAFLGYGIIKLLQRLTFLVMKIEVVKGVEKFGGIIVGFLRGIVVSSLILMTLIVMSSSYLTKSVKENSSLGPHVLRFGYWFYNFAGEINPAGKIKDIRSSAPENK